MLRVRAPALAPPRRQAARHPRLPAAAPEPVPSLPLAEPAFSADDEAHMLRALALARLGAGRVSPNPAVGCVLVRPDLGGLVVGEGYHPFAGAPHAEVFALRAAGHLACGATAYVSLEPCAHHGRTPPCCLALRDAGVARVVVACGDPNVAVAGRGLASLRAAGVDVRLGCLEADALALNADWMRDMRAAAAAAASASKH